MLLTRRCVNYAAVKVKPEEGKFKRSDNISQKSKPKTIYDEGKSKLY